jgi:hypothetical protein
MDNASFLYFSNRGYFTTIEQLSQHFLQKKGLFLKKSQEYYMFYKKIYAKKITVRFPEEQDREVFLFIRSHSG